MKYHQFSEHIPIHDHWKSVRNETQRRKHEETDRLGTEKSEQYVLRWRLLHFQLPWIRINIHSDVFPSQEYFTFDLLSFYLHPPGPLICLVDLLHFLLVGQTNSFWFVLTAGTRRECDWQSCSLHSPTILSSVWELSFYVYRVWWHPVLSTLSHLRHLKYHFFQEMATKTKY